MGMGIMGDFSQGKDKVPARLSDGFAGGPGQGPGVACRGSTCNAGHVRCTTELTPRRVELTPRVGVGGRWSRGGRGSSGPRRSRRLSGRPRIRSRAISPGDPTLLWPRTGRRWRSGRARPAGDRRRRSSEHVVRDPQPAGVQVLQDTEGDVVGVGEHRGGRVVELQEGRHPRGAGGGAERHGHQQLGVDVEPGLGQSVVVAPGPLGVRGPVGALHVAGPDHARSARCPSSSRWFTALPCPPRGRRPARGGARPIWPPATTTCTPIRSSRSASCVQHRQRESTTASTLRRAGRSRKNLVRWASPSTW